VIHDRTCRNPLAALLAAAVLACALLAAGCAATLPSDPPGVTGAVTSIAPGDGRPSSFLVESTGTQPAGAISDKAQVNIAPTTMFFGPDGKAASLDSIAGIAVGSRVSVWFQGPIAESYPVQGSAKAVQILGE
jgi:beta-N-acetylhexosaminidase